MLCLGTVLDPAETHPTDETETAADVALAGEAGRMRVKHIIAVALSALIVAAASQPTPQDWAVISICVWLLCGILGGLQKAGRAVFAYGLSAAFHFLFWLSYVDRGAFQGWADIYYFCGHEMQYCTCGFRWNLRGWNKAYVVWSFIITTAIAVQKLAIIIGLDGLLPGEEVVTRESFISICWRLIPYFLNNWEQKWGAECSSMMFELPHFAIELLIILPCVQILCARLKILAMPMIDLPAVLNQLQPGRQAQGQLGPGVGQEEPEDTASEWETDAEEEEQQGQQDGDNQPDGPAVAGQQEAGAGVAGGAGDRQGADRGAQEALPPAGAALVAEGQEGNPALVVVVDRDDYAPFILKGVWKYAPEQRKLMARLRANVKVIMFALLLSGLAAANALLMPLLLERTVSQHPATAAIKLAGQHPSWITDSGSLNMTLVTGVPVELQHDMAERLVYYRRLHRQAGKSGTSTSSPAPGGDLHGAADLLRDISQAFLLRLGSLMKHTSRFLQHVAPPDPLLHLLPAARPVMEGLQALNDYALSATNAAVGTILARLPSTDVSTQASPATGTCDPVSAPGLFMNSSSSSEMSCPAVDIAQELERLTRLLDGRPEPLPPHLVRLGPKDVLTEFMHEDGDQGCGAVDNMTLYRRNLHKHAEELVKMTDSGHMDLIPLVESALAVMRLSCEKYFVLLAILVSHLLFRDSPPRVMRAFIKTIAWLSSTFQRVILYSFPAVCWLWQAGWLFSIFVSTVFWGSAITSTWQRIKSITIVSRVRGLRHATSSEVARMGGNCAICWAGMTEPGGEQQQTTQEQQQDSQGGPQASNQQGSSSSVEHQQGFGSHGNEGPNAEAPTVDDAALNGSYSTGTAGPAPGAADAGTPSAADSDSDEHDAPSGPEGYGWSLPCGHAYHAACLTQWLRQCQASGSRLTCPMCIAPIHLDTRLKMPWSRQAGEEPVRVDELGRQPGGQGAGVPAQAPAAAGGVAAPGQGPQVLPAAAAVLPAAAPLAAVAQPHLGLARPRGGALRAALAEAAQPMLLLPPPMAALGGMHMLGLLDYQREIQELLADMPQIPVPDDVAAMQEIAAMQQQAAVVVQIPRVPPGAQPLANVDDARIQQGDARGGAGAEANNEHAPQVADVPQMAPQQREQNDMPVLPADAELAAGTAEQQPAGIKADGTSLEPSSIQQVETTAAASGSAPAPNLMTSLEDSSSTDNPAASSHMPVNLGSQQAEEVHIENVDSSASGPTREASEAELQLRTRQLCELAAQRRALQAQHDALRTRQAELAHQLCTGSTPTAGSQVSQATGSITAELSPADTPLPLVEPGMSARPGPTGGAAATSGLLHVQPAPVHADPARASNQPVGDLSDGRPSPSTAAGRPSPSKQWHKRLFKKKEGSS